MEYKKRILFIAWDGPQTSYMEGLFMPIFNKIQELDSSYQFYCLQFTSSKNTNSQVQASKEFNIPYKHIPINESFPLKLGSILTLINGNKMITKCIKDWGIDILMPRSTFPSFMVNRINKINIPIIFDADGLPIEERIDFAGLKKGSVTHKFLKSIENKMITKSDFVITRSQKSIDYHIKNYNPNNKQKFSIVSNGRDLNQFSINEEIRNQYREKLNVNDNTKVFVYAGSFGPQYGWEEMLIIFKAYHKENPDCHFLFLTGSPEKVKPLVPEKLKGNFTIQKVPFTEIPNYLNTADIAFAIRKPTFSMQGVFPIKLGEYLLMGLPTIASKDIGDTEEILKSIPGTFLYAHDGRTSLNEILTFVNNSNKFDKKDIREKAEKNFSLDAAAKSYLKALSKFK